MSLFTSWPRYFLWSGIWLILLVVLFRFVPFPFYATLLLLVIFSLLKDMIDTVLHMHGKPPLGSSFGVEHLPLVLFIFIYTFYQVYVGAETIWLAVMILAAIDTVWDAFQDLTYKK